MLLGSVREQFSLSVMPLLVGSLPGCWLLGFPDLDRRHFVTVNFKRPVPDAPAINEQNDGARIVILELAHTDELLGSYWRDRRAAEEENYKALAEAIAATTKAAANTTVTTLFMSDLPLVPGLRGLSQSPPT